MVKIETTTATQKANLRRLAKAGSASSTSFSPTMEQTSQADEVAQVQSPFASSTLFLLQEISEKAAAKQHGGKIIELLDQVRLSLLTGEIGDQYLLSLKNYLSQKNFVASDPKLKTVIEEIEQRANIELAKRDLI